MAIGVPYDEGDVATQDLPDQFSERELVSIPYVPPPPEPAPAPVPQLTDEERARALKRSKLQLQAATDEVERLKPTLSKVLIGAGLNLGEGAVGAAKQAAGNIARTYAEYADIVSPEKPHPPGSFKSFLQIALQPVLGTSPLSVLPGASTVLGEAGKLFAEQGTKQLQTLGEETEKLGGGLPVEAASGLARIAGASAPALLAAPFGLPAAAAFAGLQQYGNTISDFQQKLMELNPNLTEQQAYDKAMLPAAITGAVTTVLTRTFGGTEKFIEKLAQEGLAAGGIKGALREVFKSAALELPEEYLDQLNQGIQEKIFVNPNKPIQEIFDEAGIAGASGFALGGLTTGAITGIGHAAQPILRATRESMLRRESNLASERRTKQTIAEREAQNVQNQIAQAGGISPVIGQPVVAIPEGQAQGGAAQRGGEGGGGQTAQVTAAPVGSAWEQLNRRYGKSDNPLASDSLSVRDSPEGVAIERQNEAGQLVEVVKFSPEETAEWRAASELPSAQRRIAQASIRDRVAQRHIQQASVTTTDVVQQAINRVYPTTPPKIAAFGGYQFDNPNLPMYKIPGPRPGIYRDVTAATARQYGYAVPTAIPTYEQWVAQGKPATTEQLSPAPGGLKTTDYGLGDEAIAAAGGDVKAAIELQHDRLLAQARLERLSDVYDWNTSSRRWGQIWTEIKQDDRTRMWRVIGGLEGNLKGLDVALFNSEDAARRYAKDFASGSAFALQNNNRWVTMVESAAAARPLAADQPTNAKALLSSRGRTKGTTTTGAEIGIDQLRQMYEPSQLSRQQAPVASAALSPEHWMAFSKLDQAGYRVIDVPKLLDAIKTGAVQGGEAGNALLLHLLASSDLHPLSDIRLYNLTPDQVATQTGAQPYFGRFTTQLGSNAGRIELVLARSDGTPITQGEFVATLTHELVHNNVTSKFASAPPDVQQGAHSLFEFIQQKAQGTEWENHNATTNVQEFFSEGLSNSAFQKFLTSLTYGTGKKIRNAFNAFMEIIRRILRLPDSITTATGKKVDVNTALDEIVRLASQAEQVQRTAQARENLSPAPPALPPNLPETQLQAASNEIGRIADRIYANREKATAGLDKAAYERQQYRAAVDEIRRLTDLGRKSFEQLGLDPESIAFPNPTEGVGVVDGQIVADDTFIGKLQAGNVPHNPQAVKLMQEGIVFEQSANRYNNLAQRIDTLQKAVNYYTQLGVSEAEIKKIQDQLTKLEAKRTALGDIELEGERVIDRAGEISNAKALRRERIAARDALSLEPVADFFGRQVGAYRQLTEKIKAGVEFANQLQAQMTDPVKLKAALDNLQQWINIPIDVRNAILGGKQLTVEQKRSAFSALAQIFEEFDMSAGRMREMVDARLPELNKNIRELLLKIANAKVESGMGHVLLSDVIATMDGESGMTGNLQSLAENQALRDRISAIQKFAETLANNMIGSNAQGYQALFDWIVDPSNPPPAIAENLGVDAQTLELILRGIKRSPAFNSSVLALVEAANKKLADMPAAGLKNIEDLLKIGTPEAQAQAEAIAEELKAKADNQTSLANASLKDLLKQLDGLEIERRSLQEGQAMFEELANSPEFRAIRDKVSNSPWGLVEEMIPQNNRETTFKAFGIQGRTPFHPELVIGPNQNPQFKSEWFQRTNEWRKKAVEYLDAFDAAALDYEQTKNSANPSPSPQQLGFDIPKVHGLRDAVQRMMDGSFLDVSLNSEGGRWKVPWLARKLSKLALFRQHDFVSRLVGGVLGTDLRAKLADFTNHFLIAQSIRDEYRNLPDKLHAALLSHPELQMNLQNYREHFNEMAHWGRMFGSPVRPGFELPLSGRTVTAEDYALLGRERAYEDALRRRVTETNVTQGVRIKTPTRTLIRPGAHVGDEGLPRLLGRRADTFIADVLPAYGALHVDYLLGPNSPLTAQEKQQFSAATTKPPGSFIKSNLGPTSADPIVQFWNRNMPMLLQHVLDVRRIDRDMRLLPHMQQAEDQLMADWRTNGTPKLSSLEDLVQALTAKFPPNTGFNPREKVIEGLNAELRQFRDAAQRIATERAEAEKARQSRVRIAFSAENEFTKPAAKLELPSALYDYGAVTPGDHLAISSRANHERIVAYAAAIERAIAELQSRYHAYQDKALTEQQAAGSYGGSIKELQDVLGILRSISKDFEAAYNSGSFSRVRPGVINDTLGLLTSAILALPTVGIRNMTQGQFEVYAMSRAMGNAGHVLTAWNAFKAMPKTLTRFALHAIDGAIKRTNLGAALITGQNRHLLEDFIGKIGNMLAGEDFRAAGSKVGQLGMDNRESFLHQVRRIWQATSEFVSREDQEKIWAHNVKAYGALLPRVLRALFDKIGVQQYDWAINSVALNNAELLSQRLKQVAINYGKAREQQGLTNFDPTNPAWQLKPDEWASGPQAADNLAFMQHTLESSMSPLGWQMERSMWNYYQRQKEHPGAPLLTPEQKDALQRRLLADFNAATPANRPSAATANSILRNILLLQGYPSDLLLKIVNTAFGGARDRKGFANVTAVTPALAGMAMMAILIGYVTSAVTGSWEKYIRGRQPSLATPLDSDFWTNWKRFAEGTLALAAPQLGYLGDIILSAMGEIRQNRGFDPSGRVLGLSLATRALIALRSAYNTARGAGTAGDALVPLADVGRSLVPFWLETEHVLGQSMRARKQAERVMRGEAGIQGMMEGRTSFIPQAAGPTSVVRRNLGDAIDDWFQANKAGDAATAAQKLQDAKVEVQKLEEYHYNRYLAAGKDPATARQMAQRDTWNDYQEINPAVAALLGRRPTQGQFDLLMQGITGDRRAIVDEGLASWKAGAQALFGRPGVVTREEVAAGRGGTGGRSFAIAGLGGGGARFPTFSTAAGVPRTQRLGQPTGATASRVRRLAPAPLAGALFGHARASRQPRVPRARAVRPPSQATFRARRVARPIVNPPKTGRRSLVRRRRSIYAGA